MKTIIYFLLFINLSSVYGQCSVTLTYFKPFCTNCDGSITAVPSGSPPYNFQWSSGQNTSVLTGLCPSVYIVTMTDALNCIATESVSLSHLMSVSCNTTQPSCNTCCNGSATITVSGGFPPYTYSNSCNAQNSNVITGLCWGNCNAVVVDNTGCGTGFLIELPVMVGITEKDLKGTLSIFPNPFSQTTHININSDGTKINLVIVNIYGEVVRTITDISNRNFEFDRDKLVSGVYTIILTKDKTILVKKKVILVD